MGTQKRLYAAVILFTLAASAVFAQRNDWYQGKPIREIVFTGLRHVKASELEAIVEPYKGRIFDDNVFWEIQGKLYALEYFDMISPSAVPADAAQSEVILRFAVTERAVVNRITFTGNSGLRRSELLETVSIKVNDVVNQAKIQLDEQAIINKYLEKGYPDVKVRSETQNTGPSNITLFFHITEGEKLSIKEFRFEGNSVFSARTLKGKLSLKAKNLLNDGAFQEAKLTADCEALTRYYHDSGYIDAAVIDVGREPGKDAKGNNTLILTFKISEGRIYTFSGITFEGNEIFSTEQLSALVQSRVGDTVSQRKIEADLQRIADLYYENGYIFNTIEPQESREKASGSLSYRIVIVERGRAHIESITVRGNEKTKTQVILREVPLEPGDVFSKAKIMEAMRNLYNLQYFSMVAPDMQPGSEDSLMDLVINVEEQPTTDVQFGVTFSGSADPDTFPISGLLKINDRNFRGGGNQLGAEVNASPDTFSGSLNYTQRWIFGLPLSGGFDFTTQWTKRRAAMDNRGLFYGDETYAFPDGFNTYSEYSAANLIPPDAFLMQYEQWYLSAGFSTGYRWPTFLGNLTLNGGIRAGFIRNNYDNTLYRPFDPAIREDNNTWTMKNSFWTSLTLDQRDIFYDPSSGYYLSDRFGIYGIFNNERERYFRNDTKAEYYLTLFNLPVTDTWSFKGVFAAHAGLSFIFRQPRDAGLSALPIEDANKLAVDGMFTGRGWNNEYRRKGLLLTENWIELRFPLLPGILAFDFFFDAAGVEPKQGMYFQDFTLDCMRFSYGGGLRCTLPQFPIRFSLAKRFRFLDGEFKWEKGSVFAGDTDASGLDIVFSFAMSY